MCQQEFQAEVMAEAEQMEEAQQYAESFGESLLKMMCDMNKVRAAELDMEPHKRTGYVERLYEIADMQRKARRENGA
jgi:hypothetical protein